MGAIVQRKTGFDKVAEGFKEFFNEATKLEVVKKINDFVLDIFDFTNKLNLLDNVKVSTPVDLIQSLKIVKLFFIIPDAIKRAVNLGDSSNFSNKSESNASKIAQFLGSLSFGGKSVVDIVKLVGTFVPSYRSVLNTVHNIPVLGALSLGLAGSGTFFFGVGNIFKIKPLDQKLAAAEANKEGLQRLKIAFNQENTRGDALEILNNEMVDKANNAKGEIIILEDKHDCWEKRKYSSLKSKYELKLKNLDVRNRYAKEGRLSVITHLISHPDDKNANIAFDKLRSAKIDKINIKAATQIKNMSQAEMYKTLLNGDELAQASVISHLVNEAEVIAENRSKDRKRNIFDLVANIVAVASLSFSLAVMIATGFTVVPILAIIVSAGVVVFSDLFSLTKHFVANLAWKEQPLPKLQAASAMGAAVKEAA